MYGSIFDIKRYAIHDGPGIRTTVFLKGCNLHCNWCHNPESQSTGVVEMKQVHKLGGREFSEIINVGYLITIEDLLEEIKRDYVFFEESKGGVTFSGGEPLLQADFLLQCLKECKNNNIHTCIDTAGALPVTLLNEICHYTDLFLYDIKTADPFVFKKCIGNGFAYVRDNLQCITDNNCNVIIRIPVIPGINDDEDSIKKIIAMLKSIPSLDKVSLLPFHRTGFDKYKRLGKEWKMDKNIQSLSEKQIIRQKELFKTAGYTLW